MSVLPRTFHDLLSLSGPERLLYDAAVRFFEVTGLWRYPITAEGDLEHMALLDKIYWVYKALHPVERARPRSGLEAFFAGQEAHEWQLPPELRAEHELTLSAAGDIINHEYLSRSAGFVYEAVADVLFGADVAMANLESPVLAGASETIAISPRSGAALACDPSTFAAVRGHEGRRFALVATANNHSLDFGAEGVDSTARALADAGIAFHGTNPRGTDPANVAVLRRNGVTLGVTSITFGLNAHKPPPDRPEIVNRMNLNGRPTEIDFALLDAQLRSCAETGVDFLVAQLHWGMEHEYYPRPEQVAVAHCLAERGVDAIIGHHPHVVQPVEYYRTRRDPKCVVPIYYSLGNLINPCTARFLCQSRVARFALAKGTCDDGNIRTYVSHAGTEDVLQVADESRRTVVLQELGSLNSRRS